MPSFQLSLRPRGDWRWVFPGAGAIVGLWRAWPRLSVKYKIAGTDAEIEIRVCDLFEQDGALVVSGNTTFDTAMDDGTISKSSTQGQYATRFCDNLTNLDRQIEDSLKKQDFKQRDPEEKPYGKRKEYEIGTVASVSCGGKSAYFVAVASLDKNRRASSTLNNILDALPRLWEFVQTRGNLERIAMPIMGSGLSRVQVERERLIREIVKSFIAAARTGRFCEYLTIAISSQDFSEKKISLPKLGRFLEHECTYVSDSRPDLEARLNEIKVPEPEAEEGTPRFQGTAADTSSRTVQQDAEEAKRLVGEIREIHSEARERLAELTAEGVSQKPEEAARTAESVQRDPAASPIERAIAAAVLLQQQGRIEEAIEKWRAIATVAGEAGRRTQARAWFFVGDLFREGERTDSGAALDAYTKAIELDPDSAIGQYQADIADLLRRRNNNEAP